MLSRLGVVCFAGLAVTWAQAPIGASGAGAPTGAAGSVPTAPAMGPGAVGAATAFGATTSGAVGPAAPATPGALNPFVIAPQSFEPGVPNFTGPGTLLSNSTFFAAGTTRGITGTFPTVFGGPVYAPVGAVGFPSPVYIVIEGATAAPAQPAPATASETPQGGSITNAPGLGQFVPAAPTTYATAAPVSGGTVSSASPDVIANAGANGQTYTGGYNTTGEYQGGPEPTR